jgi:hypothetical protein
MLRVVSTAGYLGMRRLLPITQILGHVCRSPDKADAVSMAVAQTADADMVGFFHALAARGDGGAFW